MFSNGVTSDLLAAFSTVFFILTIGIGIQRLRPFTEDTLRQLTQLVMDILLPIYLFYVTAASTDPKALLATPKLIIVGILVPLISLLLAVIFSKFAKVDRAQQPAFRFSAMLGNTSFLGIPICASLFGATGAVYAVLYDFGTSLVIFTMGVWILSSRRNVNWRALVVNPFIVAVVLGLVWVWLGWELPEWFARPLSTLGSATTPLALLLVGAHLGKFQSSAVRQSQPIAWLAAIRLVITPIIVVVALRLVSPGDLFAGVIIVESAMPVGLLSAIMAHGFGLDASLPSAAILWSTLGLAITLPVLVILFI